MQIESNKIELELIVDRSGSVENESFSIEQGINLLIESFQRKYPKEVKLEVTTSIVGEDDINLPQLELENIFLKKVKVENMDIIKALDTVLKKVSEENKEQNESIEQKIILFSDGYFQNEVCELLKNEILEGLEIISIGIGDEYNKKSLKKISNDRVYGYEDIYDLF